MCDDLRRPPLTLACAGALCVLVLLGTAAPAGASTENWIGLIQVTGVLAGETKHLPPMEFGLRPDATDSFDNLAFGSSVDIDLPAPPPPPDTRPDVYLFNAAHESSVQQLQSDFRGFPADPNTGMEWTLVVDAGFSLAPDSWEIVWDVFELGLFWNTARIMNTDLGVDADLRTTQSLEVPLGAKTFYTISVTSDAVSDPVAAPSAGSVGVLTSGNVVQAAVPSSVFAGESLVLVAVASTGDETANKLIPAGFSVPSTHFLRDLTLLRSTTVVSDFPEPIEITFVFSQQDLTLEDGSIIDPGTLVPFVISGSTIEVLPVVSRSDTSITFTVAHLSVIGLGVSEANDPPTVRESIADQTVKSLPGEVRIELSASATESIFFDDETPVSDLTYTAETDQPDIISDPVFNGTELILTPALLAQGTATITVTATDSAGLSTPLDFGVTVSAPILADIPDQTMTEEGELTLTLTLSAVNSSGVLYTAGSDESQVGVNVLGDTLTLTPDRDYAGEAAITVNVADETASPTRTRTSTWYWILPVCVA